MRDRRLLLHIGSPKTGTTTLQATLKKNRERLLEQGVFVPAVLGDMSHIRLTAYAQPDDSFTTRPRVVAGITNSDELIAFRRKLETDFADVLAGAGAGAALTIITSESLGSNLRTPDDIARVKSFLAPHFSEIQLLFYVRRQDLRAVSDFDQSIKAGNPRNRFFNTGFAYEYDKMYRMWAEVFAGYPFQIKVFEPGRLQGGDIVQDFLEFAGIDPASLAKIERRNTSLSAQAQLSMRAVVQGARANDIALTMRDRRLLMDRLRGWFPGTPLRPARKEAEAFLHRYDASNAALFEAAGIEGFNDDFSMYPEAAPSLDKLERQSVRELRQMVTPNGRGRGRMDRDLVIAVLEAAQAAA